jgi:DNA-binding MarR family transcriptional regulator
MNNPPKAAARTARDPGELMFALMERAHGLEDRLEEALAGVGTSIAKHGVLRLLVEAGEPVALSALAERQACVRSNMTQLVDRLEAEGSVERKQDPNDRRSVRASLTPLGRELQEAGQHEIDRVRNDFIASLSKSDLAALERVISALG